MLKGYVTSDWHMFSRRSTATANQQQIKDAMAQADIFVLNGDIFDFRWSQLPSIAATITAGIQLLETYTRDFPDCHFHFILGNHDCIKVFVEALDEFAKRTSNFTWHRFYLKLGERLFLHGDVIHAPEGEWPEQYRAAFEEGKSRGWLGNLGYKVMIFFGLHKFLARLVTKRYLTAKLIANLPQLLTSKVDEIYCGHTHQAFFNYSYQKWKFHNTGAMIQGIPWKLLAFTVRHQQWQNHNDLETATPLTNVD